MVPIVNEMQLFCLSCFEFWVSVRSVSLKYRNDQNSPRKTAKRKDQGAKYCS